MKSCPACNRTFEDTMTFCLIDGSVLSAPFDAKATQDHPATRHTDPSPTAILDPGPRVSNPIQPTQDNNRPTPPETIASPTPTSGTLAETVSSIPPEYSSHKPLDSPSAMKTIKAAPPEVMSGKNQPAPYSAETQPSELAHPHFSGGKRLAVIAVGVLAILFVGAIVWLILRPKTPTVSTVTEAPQSASQNKNQEQTAGKSLTANVNGAQIQMVSIVGGTFLMGSPLSEMGRDKDEGPQNEVTVQSFDMSKYEVTQEQYKVVMGTNPSNFKGDNLPVDSVTWNNAVEFCRKLSETTGRTYRLPTEAEWEYASRAGTSGPYSGNIDAMTWYGPNSASQTHPVGQKQPNGFGLYDMNGNVWEWCQSKYGPYPYKADDGRENLQDNDVRVMRGGSYESSASSCRSAYRRRVIPDVRSIGFRVVAVP